MLPVNHFPFNQSYPTASGTNLFNGIEQAAQNFPTFAIQQAAQNSQPDQTIARHQIPPSGFGSPQPQQQTHLANPSMYSNLPQLPFQPTQGYFPPEYNMYQPPMALIPWQIYFHPQYGMLQLQPISSFSRSFTADPEFNESAIPQGFSRQLFHYPEPEQHPFQETPQPSSSSAAAAAEQFGAEFKSSSSPLEQSHQNVSHLSNSKIISTDTYTVEGTLLIREKSKTISSTLLRNSPTLQMNKTTGIALPENIIAQTLMHATGLSNQYAPGNYVILFQNDFIRAFVIRPNIGKVTVKLPEFPAQEYQAGQITKVIFHSLFGITEEEQLSLKKQLGEAVRQNPGYHITFVN